ncbi:MAG: MaoC family dehydratase [Rhodospirillaceae bacterium]|nr:MaoC family dehydratase [Rhodospirillaceae bacterium]
MTRTFSIDDEVPALSKTMTQAVINLFEKSGGAEGPSQFTDEETARGVLGTSGTVASGRMSLTFASELLRRYFGNEVYNRGGMIELRFLRPVRPGDTVTFTGKVTGFDKVTNGVRVAVDVTATNQKGDTTGVGAGACIVPSLWVPEAE